MSGKVAELDKKTLLPHSGDFFGHVFRILFFVQHGEISFRKNKEFGKSDEKKVNMAKFSDFNTLKWQI